MDEDEDDQGRADTYVSAAYRSCVMDERERGWRRDEGELIGCEGKAGLKHDGRGIVPCCGNEGSWRKYGVREGRSPALHCA